MLSRRAVKRIIRFDQGWRRRADGVSAEVCRIHRKDEQVYLRAPDGAMWRVSFAQLGSEYERLEREGRQ